MCDSPIHSLYDLDQIIFLLKSLFFLRYRLYFTEHFKVPVSTTHTITGSIIGVGLTKRVSAVRWGVTVSLLWAWVLTIPVSAVLAALVYYILSIFLG